MDNQVLAGCTTSNDKVLNWLNNSNITTKDKTCIDLSKKNLDFRDCYLDAENLNEHFYCTATIDVNGKSFENWQTKNDEQVNSKLNQKLI